MSALISRERPAAGEPEGLLVLHHGRGADEHDLLRSATCSTPRRRLHVVTPRAPLQLAGSPGYHWYLVPRVGYPDPDSFEAARRQLGELHDELWRQTGIPPERTVLGGFSMGAVDELRPGSRRRAPSARRDPRVLRLHPRRRGLAARPRARTGVRVFIAHGRRDQVIDSRLRARRRASGCATRGLPVDYHESDAAHHIDPAGDPGGRAG